jgi:hypothetical protein
VKHGDKRIIWRSIRGRGQPGAGTDDLRAQYGARRHSEGHRTHRASARSAPRSDRRCASGLIFVGIDVIDGFDRDQRHLADRHPAIKNLGGPDVAAMIGTDRGQAHRPPIAPQASERQAGERQKANDTDGPKLGQIRQARFTASITWSVNPRFDQ